MEYTEEWLEESISRVYNRSVEENKRVHSNLLNRIAQATLEHNKDAKDQRVINAKKYL